MSSWHLDPELAGRACWMWDRDMEMHIPCCYAYVEYTKNIEQNTKAFRRCLNGPLMEHEIEEGLCNEHRD